MMGSAFNEMMQGLNEVESFLEGETTGFKVHVPESVDVKQIRTRLHMTQARFSDAFGFSLDAIKHWEGGRRQPEVAARAYLTVIAKEPEAVTRALGRGSVTRRRTSLANSQDVAVLRSRRKNNGTVPNRVKAGVVAARKVAV
jgi:putative transcriptional regulator